MSVEVEAEADPLEPGMKARYPDHSSQLTAIATASVAV